MDNLNYRSFYRDHALHCRPQTQDDGRFQARVVVSAVGSMAARTKRLLGLAFFDLLNEAVEHARLAGMEWVDKNFRSISGA